MKIRNKIDSTELINAAITGSLIRVQKLIPSCNINEQNSLGNTALMLTRNPEIIKTLISAGARINDCNHNNDTALILAVKNNILPKVQLLLGYSQTDIHVRNNDGNTALTYAKEGSVIHKILTDEATKQAAKIVYNNHRAKFPIHDDEEMQDVDIAQQYASEQSGHDNNYYSRIPNFLSSLVNEQLTLAPKNNIISSIPVVDTQINSIIIGIQNKTDGDTAALMFARENKLDRDIILKLVKSNKDLLNIQNDYGDSVLINAVVYGKIEVIELLMKLRNEGIRINLDLPDADGNTALHYAVRDYELAIVECLIMNGANPNLRNSEKQTSFDLVINNDETMLSILGANQIDIE